MRTVVQKIGGIPSPGGFHPPTPLQGGFHPPTPLQGGFHPPNPLQGGCTKIEHLVI